MAKVEQRVAGSAVRATLLFSLACLAAFVVALTWVLVQSYQDSIARAETRAHAYAQVVSANASLLMESSYQALRRIDAAVGDQLEAPSSTQIGDLNQAVGNLPPDLRAWLIDANGTPRLSNTTLSKAFNVADRDYFVGLKNGQEFRISPLIVSRTQGDAVFAVAKRIERAGAFVGAAVIIIPAKYLDQFRASLELGAQSTVGLIREDGMLVSRSPVPAEATDLSQYVLFTDYLKRSDEGTYPAVSPTDGIRRIVAYRRIPGFPLIAIASIATDEALDTFKSTALTIGLFAVPGLVGLGIFALWMLRTQRELALALTANRTLFKEIHHRVKNNLQQAMALVNMQDIPAEAREKISRRFAAMAAVHEQMYRSDEYATVLASDVLPTLVNSLRETVARQTAIETEVAAAVLDRDKALPVSLIVSEVIANAVKHAFVGRDDGKIVVRLERIAMARARLTIADNGVGYGGVPDKKGTGTKLITALAKQLGSSPVYDGSHGTTFTLDFDVFRFEG